MNVLFPSKTLEDPEEIIKIVSNSDIKNEANNPSDEFLQFLHFNLSFIVRLYLENKQNHNPDFYLNSELIFKSNCDDIKIIMSTDEQLLNIIFNFLQTESKKTTYLIRGRFCQILGQLLLLSDIDYTSHISKYKTQTVFFNNKSEIRNCGGILFLILLVDNIHYLPFFDLIYDIIKSHTYTALTFFEENFFTQILLNKLATTNKNSIVSSLNSPISFSDENLTSKQNEENSEKIIFTNTTENFEDDPKLFNLINNNVLLILMHLTCNLSRNSSLVTPLLKKSTILTLLDASLNEEKFHIFSAFQLITSLHKQSNQCSREAIETINGRLPIICHSIMNFNNEQKKGAKIKKAEISLITLFSSIVNDIYGVAGESIPEPINYKMKKSVHLSDSLELFNIRQKAKSKNMNVSRSQDSYYIDNQFDSYEEEEEEEDESEWNESENDNENHIENEIERPMNLNEFTRKKFQPIFETIEEETTEDKEENKEEENELKQEQKEISQNETKNNEEENENENLNKNDNDENEQKNFHPDKACQNVEKKKNIPQIPNFSKATSNHHHHHKSRHSTSILTYKDLEAKSHSGSNSGRIYKKQNDNLGFKNVGIINVAKGFTAFSGCGRLSIKQQPNSSNENFFQKPTKVNWMSNEYQQIKPKTDDDKFGFTPTSSSSSSSRLDLPKLEIKEEEEIESNNDQNLQHKIQKQQIQQLQKQIQYNYSFSDTHIIHAPESSISPVTKDPTTGENLSLMDFANQAPSNPQIDLLFHQRTKSCNSIDYISNSNSNNSTISCNNNKVTNTSDYSLSTDQVEDENISLLDLANSINNSKAKATSTPMYNGQFGAPPVSDLYPLLQSTPVFFNNALSPRDSRPQIQSYSSRTEIDKDPMMELLSATKKVNDYTSSFNSNSNSNSTSSDLDIKQKTSQEQNNNDVVLDTFPTSPSAKNNGQFLTSLNLQNLNNNNNNSFTVSTGLRTRKSLSELSSAFSLLNSGNANDINSDGGCNGMQNLSGANEGLNPGFGGFNSNYHYPNSARPTRPSFLPSSDVFTIQEDPSEDNEKNSAIETSNSNQEKEIEEEDEIIEEEEEDEEEAEAEEPEDIIKALNEEEEEELNEIETETETAETNSKTQTKSETNENTENDNFNDFVSSLISGSSSSSSAAAAATSTSINDKIESEAVKKAKISKSKSFSPNKKIDDSHSLTRNSSDTRITTIKKNKKKSKRCELIIQTTCFLIDQFFANPNNSFLHNIVIDLIKTFYRFTHLTTAIYNRSRILYKIAELYKNEKNTNLPFSGHIHKLVEIAQKLNFRMLKFVCKKEKSKQKGFPIFEEDEWKCYIQNVFDVENETMKKNYGGFHPELYSIMKDSKERVLRPDL